MDFVNAVGGVLETSRTMVERSPPDLLAERLSAGPAAAGPNAPNVVTSASSSPVVLAQAAQLTMYNHLGSLVGANTAAVNATPARSHPAPNTIHAVTGVSGNRVDARA